MEGFKKFVSKFKKGDIIYSEGDEQANFYIINKGRVQLKTEEDHNILVSLSKGQFFGEESLNDSQLAAYTVEAIEDSDIIKIPYDALQDMMKQSLEISIKILKKLSEKHIKTIENVLRITRAAAPVVTKPSTNDKAKEETSERIDPNIKAYLVIQRSNRIVQLTKKKTYLGRRDYTTGFVPDIDLTKEDEEKYISRKHAGIIYVDGKFYVQEEPGAVNGTFLNGNKMNTGVKYELKNEDELTLCHIQMIFKH
jgi:CRP-like cAMP-binding protein